MSVMMCNLTVNFTDKQYSNLSPHRLNVDLLVSLLPVTIFIGIEVVCGLIGNILILCVYSKLYLHCNFRYFVLSLAIYDLTSCLTTLPGEMYSEFNWYDYKYGWYCKFKSFFNVFTVWGSAFTLLLLGYDRYRKICRPLDRQIRPSLARKFCVCGVILSTVVSVPALILWGIQQYPYIEGTECIIVSICEKSGSYADDAYPFIYITSVYVLPVGIMIIAISVWNVRIGRKLYCKGHSTATANSSDTRARAIIRNTSDSSDISRLSVHVGILKMLCFRSSIRMESNERNTRQVRRNSATSVTSFSLADVPRRDKFYITPDFGEDHLGMTNTDLNSIPYDGSVRPYSSSQAKGTNSTSFLRNEVELVPLACENGPYLNSSCTTGSVSVMERLVPNGCMVGGASRVIRRKRKTFIMLILTSVFIITLLVYIILVSLVAGKQGILRKLSNTEITVFFFFLRINFVNCVINPIVYGIMDPRFRAGMKVLLCSCKFRFKH